MVDVPERSHYLREPAPWVGGCSDTGLRHRINQDALSLAVRHDAREAILAVSDGVTTAPGSEVASLEATETIVARLVAASQAALPMTEALRDGFQAAHEAICAHDQPAACTLLAAKVERDTIVLGNVGDCRAYWLGDDGSAELLTTDDSMAQARMLFGMSREEAETSAQAHAITKWLGRMATDVAPSLSEKTITQPGWLLLCSDGLWNYASAPEAMAEAFRECATGQEPVLLAEALVAWALARGGKDNVTVVVARIEPLG